MEIISCKNKATEKLVKTGKTKKGCKWASLRKIALRKIDMIVFADSINDLKSPPSNHLETLSGNLKGYWSIRINDQFRIIFEVEGVEIHNLEIVDYH